MHLGYVESLHIETIYIFSHRYCQNIAQNKVIMLKYIENFKFSIKISFLKNIFHISRG